MSNIPNQYGVKGSTSKPPVNQSGHPVKHTDGTANKGATVKVHRAGK